MSVKGKYLGKNKRNLWISTWLHYGCHSRDTFTLSFQDSLQGTKIEGEICKKVSQEFLPTVWRLICKHFQWNLIQELTLLQHPFQCFVRYQLSLWMTSNWARVNNTLRQWVMGNPASTKPKAKPSS